MTVRIKVPGILLALLLLFAGPVQADVVWLKSGDRVSGKVESLDGSALRIKTDWGGTVTIKRDAIASIRTDSEINLMLYDGERVEARLDRDRDEEGDELKIVAEDQEPRGVTLQAVRYASVDAAVDRPGDRWQSRLTYGLNISTGNTDTENHSLRASSTLRRGPWRHQGNADLDLKKDSGTTTREQYRVGYQLDWFFRENWFAFGSSEYFQDELRGVDYRVTLGGGLGHQFWDNTLGALSLEGGISEVIEKVGGESDNNRALRAGLDYNRFYMGKRLELFHGSELLVLAERDRGEILKTSTGVRYALNSFLSTNFRVDFDHETEPSPGRKKSDLVYVIGVGFTW
ncbi:MAG: DUF481 domain-containing protein [Gammaproteobacteria bacterium]|nr:DUF481 domain-containing protein [Gammaproteobacteria bacterium]